MRRILGSVLLAMLLLSAGCATLEAQATYSPRPEPAFSRSWWGSDPVCAPGCPPGVGDGW